MLFNRLGVKIALWIGSFGAVLALLFGVYRAGETNERTETRVEAAEAAKEALETVHEVESAPDRDAAVERMRRNGLVRD